MAKLTQWRIHSPRPADNDGRAAVMATRAELVKMLASFNIAPERDDADFEGHIEFG